MPWGERGPETKQVDCPNCEGQGYIVRVDRDGNKAPYHCQTCDGTGKTWVRHENCAGSRVDSKPLWSPRREQEEQYWR